MDIFQHFRNIIAGRPNPFVMEFGACDGYHSNLLVQAIKQADPRTFRFLTFEPRADLLPQVRNNLHGHLNYNNGVIGIFPYAIGSINGYTTFWHSFGEKYDHGKVVDRYYGSSSIRKPTELNEQQWRGMQFKEDKVEVVRLDSFLTHWQLQDATIDFIWADIQGAEIDLITGGKTAMTRTRYLYTEYSEAQYYEGQVGLQAILDATGFEVVENYGSDVLLRNPNL